jgi:methyl-accepting chemotaxis protein
VADLALSGDQKSALAALKESNKLSNHLNLTIAEICRLREEAAKDSQAQCEWTYRRSRTTIMACTIFSVLFGTALCLLTVRMIARPLLQVMATLQRASNGDLTERVKVQNKDEIGSMGAALNEALESTRAVLQKVRETVAGLGTVSAELVTTADGMAAGAKTQAAGFEQTSASLEQITVTARNNAEHARQASEVAIHSHQVAQKGHSVVAAAVEAMFDINESSEKISQVVSAVDDVAFQTNLLSVNAAIEAARAGEQGKTFGVVAEEIRNLSKRSAESARGIRKLIQDSLHTVKKGSTSINASGEALKHLSSSVNEVRDFVAQIVTSSQEQSVGVEQVHSAVLRMEKVTHSNEAQASRLSSVATTLTDQASHLESMLNQFSLDAAK